MSRALQASVPVRLRRHAYVSGLSLGQEAPLAVGRSGTVAQVVFRHTVIFRTSGPNRDLAASVTSDQPPHGLHGEEPHTPQCV